MAILTIKMTGLMATGDRETIRLDGGMNNCRIVRCLNGSALARVFNWGLPGGKQVVLFRFNVSLSSYRPAMFTAEVSRMI